jgi:hypothetical protein
VSHSWDLGRIDPGVWLVTCPVGIARADTRIDPMSDHTEQVRNLRDRILAAKEFL